MTPPKPAKTLAGQQCPICDAGKFQLAQINYTEEVASDNPIEIRGLWVDRCDHCGEIVFPGDTTRFIESIVAEKTEQLTPRELERIREELGVDRQDEMSEILGLGAKTYHKWESGAQFPTRSMSYYIRVLADCPEAFEWLRQRAWRKKNRLTHPQDQTDFADMFPDLPTSAPQASRTATPRAAATRINPALGLTRVAFCLK